MSPFEIIESLADFQNPFPGALTLLHVWAVEKRESLLLSYG